MATIERDKTVGEYVREKPSLSRVFEHYGIDYCCGGKKALAIACHEKGVPVEEVLSALAHAAETAQDGEALNWQDATFTQMTEHIFDRHHQYLYEVMPRLSFMVNKVARVHGDKDSRLAELAATCDVLIQELEVHMRKEEQVLFPYCRQFDTAEGVPSFHCGPISNPIRVMETEHEAAGALLEKMRELTDGYTPPEWACNTYRAMLDGLKEMESDLHQHIHKENNILFPKALKAAGL